MVAHGVVVDRIKIVPRASEAPICPLEVALAAEVVAQTLVVQCEVARSGISRVGRSDSQIFNSLWQIVAVKLKVTEKAIEIELFTGSFGSD